MPTAPVVVGVLARIDVHRSREVSLALEAVRGVSVFEVPAPPAGGEIEGGRIGVLIEAEDLDAAHAVLRGQVDRTPGVLGTWPVAVESGDGFGAAVDAPRAPEVGAGPQHVCSRETRPEIQE